MSANPRVNQNLDSNNANLYTSNPNSNPNGSNVNTNSFNNIFTNKNVGSREAASREEAEDQRFNKPSTVDPTAVRVGSYPSVRVVDEQRPQSIQQQSSQSNSQLAQAQQPAQQLQSQSERQSRQRKQLAIEVAPFRVNKLRKLLERVKAAFNLRLGDSRIIDTLLRCAENIDVDNLHKYLLDNYSKPAFLPDEEEFIEFNGLEINNQLKDEARQRNLQVPLSTPSYTYLSGIQNELAELMGSQPDINAVANAIIDTGRHRPREIVLAISEYNSTSNPTN